MTYDIYPKRIPMMAALLAPIIILETSGDWDESFLLVMMKYGFYLLIAILLGLLRFSFQIEPHSLIYRISFWEWTVLKMEIEPEEISRVRFFRVSWKEKAAVVKRKRGMNIRLVVFKSPEAYEALIEFCDDHEVEVVKTRDYLLIEKWEKKGQFSRFVM